MEELEVLNLQRMFLGTETSWLFLLEVVIRTVIMFSWTLINIRLLSKRNIGQLTPFEFLITFALGSATGDPMFYPEVPLLHGMVVLTSIVLLEKTIAYISRKSTKFERFSQGNPSLLVKNGKILEKALDNQNLNKDELFARLRLEGVENTGEVKYAFLEISGKLSVIKFPKDKQKKGESTLASISKK